MARTADSTSSTEAESKTKKAGAAEHPSGAGTIAVGRVVGAHGLRGQLRVRHFADDPADLAELPLVWLDRAGESVSYDVRQVSPGRPGELRLALAGVSRREDAEALCGRLVLARPTHLREPGEGEYYGHQLLGCRVESEGGRSIGTVTGIWSTGAPDVLVVSDDQGREQLIPAAADLLAEVDSAAGRIVVREIPGLLEPTRAV